MGFDLDSVTFHLSKFEDEIVLLTKDLDPIHYSALMGTIGGMYRDKKESFTDSKRMAWEIFQLIKGVAAGNFPPPLEVLTDGPSPDRIEDNCPPPSELVPGLRNCPSSLSPECPPLHGGHENRPNPNDHS